MYTSLSVVIPVLLGLAYQTLAEDEPPKGIVYFPTYFGTGAYPRVMTNISLGTPAQKKALPVVVDQGSANYWVLEKGAIINYGSNQLGVLGPCNITARPSYNDKASKTVTKRTKKDAVYAYGGNGKIVSSYFTVNDTTHFDKGPLAVTLTNRRVAVANFTLLKLLADNCDHPEYIIYDHGILGVSRFKNPSATTTGPSFRQDLLDDGLVNSPSMSMWFDRGPRDGEGNFRGTTLFGGVATKKYKGPLVLVKPSPPKGGYVGYYVPAPSISTTNVYNSSKKTKLKTGKTKRCLVDSGTGTENLAIDEKAFNKASGLVVHNGYPSFNGTCEDLGKSDAALSFTFPGLNKGKSVTIDVPLANFMSNSSGDSIQGSRHFCQLQMDLSRGYNCVLAAGFNTGLFMAVNDDKNEIALAQGGVSLGAVDGAKGLGKVTVLKKGDSLTSAGAV